MTNQLDNCWNELIKIRDTHLNEHIRNNAAILLSQIATAGGKDMIRHELVAFFDSINDN